MAEDPSPSLVDQVGAALKSLGELSAEGVASALGLWTAARAAISTVAGGIAAAASQGVINTAMAKYHDTPVSPAALAVAIVRNVLPDSSGGAGKPPPGYPAALYTGIASHSATDEAALSGLDGNRFAALVGSTGMAYGIVDALRLYNRNTGMWALKPNPSYTPTSSLYVASTDLGPAWGIQLPEVYEVIAHSDVRPEYSSDLLKLSRDTLTPAAVVEMVVKQIIPADVGADLYAAAGGFPEQFDALVAAAGDSAGLEKAVSLWCHGAITTEELAQVLALSRTNPRFYPLYTPVPDGAPPVNPGDQVNASAPAKWQAGWGIPANAHYLGAFEVGDLVKNGQISSATALQWLLQEGYPQDQADAYSSAKALPSSTAKSETEAMVLDEYASGALTTDQATKALEDLGYTSVAVPFLLAYAAARESIGARNTAVARVRAAYLHGAITENQAKVDLTGLGVPTAAIKNYVAAWGVEAATPSTHLSETTIGWLVEKGHITPAVAVAKWQAMGLSAVDATLLLYRYPPPVPVAEVPPTSLTGLEG